jgi:hypothetical protein
MRLVRNSVVCAVLLAVSAFAGDAVQVEETLQDVVARLAAHTVVRGKFRQSREIELLSEPLESSGSFLLSDRGLYWRQEQPLASVLIADGERMLQQVDDGPSQSLDVAEYPMVLPFSRVFLSIFKGSEDELRQNFDIVFTVEEQVWKIALTPISYPLSEAIDTILLRGREYIEELTVVSRSSDETMIQFFDLQALPDQLTEHEIKLYAR